MDKMEKVVIACYVYTVENEIMTIVNFLLEILSVLFLVLTLYVYWKIPEMRETQVRNLTY